MIGNQITFFTKDYIDDDIIKQIKTYIQSVTKCKNMYTDFWEAYGCEEDVEPIPF